MLSTTLAAGPSAVPLLVEVAVAAAVGAGIVVRRPVGRIVVALRRRRLPTPSPSRASGPAPGA